MQSSFISASGNVAQNVVIEKQNETTVIFTEGANEAYLGYVTVRFSPDPASNVPHHQHFCIEVPLLNSASLSSITASFAVRQWWAQHFACARQKLSRLSSIAQFLIVKMLAFTSLTKLK
jgi:hypothetical protein